MNTQTQFFPVQLAQGRQRLSPDSGTYAHELDKNEQPEDVPGWLKLQVLEHAMNEQWNRYPSLDHSDIESAIAAGLDLRAEQVLLGAGSATFITTLLNYFGLQRRQLVIAQPSYSLFDYHCRSYGIPYSPWMLNGALEYDESLLPALEPGAVLFIVSPNNPVGNTIPRSMLERILQNNPQSMVVLDAVYAGFAADDLCDLLPRYRNLLIMRSFSKELPVAGLRLGYLCGDETLINPVRNLLLPFSINPLSLAFATHMLFDAEFQDWAAACRTGIRAERQRVRRVLGNSLPPTRARVYPSDGNFLLVRIYDDADFRAVRDGLAGAGIKVLDTSAMPLLRNTLRISIGSYASNEALTACLQDVLQAADCSIYA